MTVSSNAFSHIACWFQPHGSHLFPHSCHIKNAARKSHNTSADPERLTVSMKDSCPTLSVILNYARFRLAVKWSLWKRLIFQFGVGRCAEVTSWVVYGFHCGDVTAVIGFITDSFSIQGFCPGNCSQYDSDGKVSPDGYYIRFQTIRYFIDYIVGFDSH